MALRWTAAGLLEAQKTFRRLKAYLSCPSPETLSRPRFPRWIANLMACLGGYAIRINAIPSSRRAKPISPGG